MHKPYRLAFRIFLNWLDLIINPKKLIISGLDVDQSLLFEGGKCVVLWNIGGAAFVKLYLNGKLKGRFLPMERPAVDLSLSTLLEIKAFGLWKSREASALLNVKHLSYKQARPFVIEGTAVKAPRTVNDIQINNKGIQPLNLNPVIRSTDIVLDSDTARQAEINLQEQITNSYT